MACVPGCEAVEGIELGTRYQAVVCDKVGPLTLRVLLAVEVLKATAPTRLRARAQGRDTAVQSLVAVDLTFVLVEPSAQTMTLEVEAEVTVLGLAPAQGSLPPPLWRGAVSGCVSPAIQAEPIRVSRLRCAALTESVILCNSAVQSCFHRGPRV